MPRLKHVQAEGHPYFITTNTRANIKVFSNKNWADSLLSCIYFGRENKWYFLLSFVIMPEHLHLVIVPRGKKASQIMKAIKGYSARVINSNSQSSGPLWKKSFYDYVLDSEAKLLMKIKYVEENAVRGGLVSRPESYRYSSGHKQNSTDLGTYLDGKRAGQECPAYP